MFQSCSGEDLVAQATEELQKRKKLYFGRPNYDHAIELMEKAGWVFETENMLDRAANAYLAAANIYIEHDKQSMAMNLVNSAIHCLSHVDPLEAIKPLELLIRLSKHSGRELEAGKVCVIVAQVLEEREEYDVAIELLENAVGMLESEANADAELRNAILQLSELRALHLCEYQQSMQQFEAVAMKCATMPILVSHANAIFLKAALCAALARDAPFFSRLQSALTERNRQTYEDFFKALLNALPEFGAGFESSGAASSASKALESSADLIVSELEAPASQSVATTVEDVDKASCSAEEAFLVGMVKAEPSLGIRASAFAGEMLRRLGIVI